MDENPYTAPQAHSYSAYLNATREDLRKLLGEPTDFSIPRRKWRRRIERGSDERGYADVWRYGLIEYHFDDEGRVRLIYTEDEEGNPNTLAARQ